MLASTHLMLTFSPVSSGGLESRQCGGRGSRQRVGPREGLLRLCGRQSVPDLVPGQPEPRPLGPQCLQLTARRPRAFKGEPCFAQGWVGMPVNGLILLVCGWLSVEMVFWLGRWSVSISGVLLNVIKVE